MAFISMNLVTMLYLVASVCFIQALKGLSSPASARRGNAFGMAGMAIAVVTTIALIARLQADSGTGMGFGPGGIRLALGVIAGGAVRLGIDAPRSVSIYREEIWAAVKEENQASAEAEAECGDQARRPPLVAASKPEREQRDRKEERFRVGGEIQVRGCASHEGDEASPLHDVRPPRGEQVDLVDETRDLAVRVLSARAGSQGSSAVIGLSYASLASRYPRAAGAAFVLIGIGVWLAINRPRTAVAPTPSRFKVLPPAGCATIGFGTI